MKNNNCKKILVVRYGTIGDTIFTIPVFKELRNYYGEKCQIDAFANNQNKVILENIPYVNNVLNIEKIAPLNLKNAFRWIPVIRHYNKIYFLCESKKLSIISMLAGVKERRGFKLKGNLHNYFLTKETVYDTNVHTIQAYLNILRDDNINTEPPVLENIFQNLCSKKQTYIKGKYVAIQPFARNKLKNWDIKKWYKVIEFLIKNNYEVAILGSEKDIDTTKPLEFSENIHNFCGLLTLDETIRIIDSSEFFIGIDSGLIHISATLDKPSILLNGSTSLTNWRPFYEKCKIITKNYPCSPCCFLMTKNDMNTCDEAECMKTISTEDVENAIKELLVG